MSFDPIAFAEAVKAGANFAETIVKSEAPGAVDLRFFLVSTFFGTVFFLFLMVDPSQYYQFFSGNLQSWSPILGAFLTNMFNLQADFPLQITALLAAVLSIVIGSAVTRFGLGIGKPQVVELRVPPNDPYSAIKRILSEAEGIELRLDALFKEAPTMAAQFGVRFVLSQKSPILGMELTPQNGPPLTDEATFVRATSEGKLYLVTMIDTQIMGPKANQIVLQILIDLDGVFDRVESDRPLMISGEWHRLGGASQEIGATGHAHLEIPPVVENLA
ncbi:MAG: hypothetical protein ACKVPY_01765 [Paracoccaceae bacterium]